MRLLASDGYSEYVSHSPEITGLRNLKENLRTTVSSMRITVQVESIYFN